MELIVWGEQVNGHNNVTVNLGGAYKFVKVYDPTIAASKAKMYSDVSSIPLTLSDHALIIEFGAATTLAANPALMSAAE